MARIVGTGKGKFKVVNSINGRTVKGGSGLTAKQAAAKKKAVVKKNCGAKHQRCKN